LKRRSTIILHGSTSQKTNLKKGDDRKEVNSRIKRWWQKEKKEKGSREGCRIREVKEEGETQLA
jgi:hypothetical protein